MKWHNSITKRRKTGSATAEFVVAVGVVFIVFFFPFVDFLVLSYVYGSGYFLNTTQLREAALTKASKVDAQMTSITDTWAASGLGSISTGNGKPITKVTYRKILGGDYIVKVTTTVKASPWVKIPFMDSVAGFGAPMEFTYSGERLLENPKNYDLP